MPSSFPSPSVYFSRGNGREKLLAYRFASDVDVEYWHTGRSSNLERKFWRNGATTRRDALASLSTRAVATFVWCFLFAFHLSHCIRGGVNVRDAWRETKCDWHLGEKKNILLSSPLPPRDEERTRQKRRRPPRAFHSWRMKVAFRALTRAPIVRHGYSISTGGEERDTCPIPTSSETHRERDFVVSFSHTARYLIDAAPRNDFRETFEDECSLFSPFIDKVSVFSGG